MGLELIPLVQIGTDCKGSYKSDIGSRPRRPLYNPQHTNTTSFCLYTVADLLPAYCKRNYAPLFGITIFLKLLFCFHDFYVRQSSI